MAIEFRKFTDTNCLLGVFKQDNTRLGIYDVVDGTFNNMSIDELEQILSKMKALQDSSCIMQGENA